MRSCLPVAACLMLASGTASAQERATELPKDVVLAWRKLGAEYGKLQAWPRTFPGFTLKVLWRKGWLDKAPTPERPFGLNFQNIRITDTVLKDLVRFKQLSFLNLSGNKITDAGLKELGQLKKLSWLDLSGTKVTDAGLKELAGLPLSRLILRNEQVTDGVLKVMRATGKLHALSVAHGAPGQVCEKDEDIHTLLLYLTPVTDEGLKELADLKNLSRLDLGSHITDEGLKEVAALKELTTLRMIFSKVKGPGLKHLAGLPKLETLTVGNLSDARLKALCEAKLLQRTRNASTADFKKRPARMEDIAHLSLINNAITDEGLKELTALPNLAVLQLNGTRITDAGLKELTKLPKLASLDLLGTQTCDTTGLKNLAGCKELTHLCTGAKMTDAGLKALVHFKKLTSLKLSNRITNAGVKDLTVLKNLTKIVFFGSLVTRSGAEALRKALPNCKISGSIRRD